MQEKGTSAGEKDIYLEESNFNKLIENMNESAAYMTIPKEAFDNFKAANGTDSIKKMNSKWKKIRKMTNRYKEFLSIDVSLAYAESIKRINETAQASGDGINSKKH